VARTARHSRSRRATGVSARHFVLWVDGDRTRVATCNAFRRGQASWRHDEALSVPEELVTALGWEDWQTPENGPFPAFGADKLSEMVQWLVDNGYTARALAEPPA